MDRDVLEGASHLRAIVFASTGLDHIDLSCAAEHGVMVLGLKDDREFLDSVTGDRRTGMDATDGHSTPPAVGVCSGARRPVGPGRIPGPPVVTQDARNPGLRAAGKYCGRVREGLPHAGPGLRYRLRNAADGVEMTDFERLMEKSDVEG